MLKIAPASCRHQRQVNRAQFPVGYVMRAHLLALSSCSCCCGQHLCHWRALESNCTDMWFLLSSYGIALQKTPNYKYSRRPVSTNRTASVQGRRCNVEGMELIGTMIGIDIPYLTQYKTRTQYKTPPTVYNTPVVILGVSDRPSIYHRGYTI